MSRFGRAVAALTFSVSALTSTLAAADDAPPPPAPAAEAPRATPLGVRPSKPIDLAPAPSGSHLGAGLGVLALAIGLGVWVVKRRAGSSRGGKERTIHIAARRAIGVRSELLVVEVDGSPMLIGVTPGSIQRLAMLPDANGDRMEADFDAERMMDVEPGFKLPPQPVERERERERERDLPITVPEPRRTARPQMPPSGPRGARVRDSLPLEEQVRGLMRDRRVS